MLAKKRSTKNPHSATRSWTASAASFWSNTFNEAPDIEGPTLQHIITPDIKPMGIAFIWRKFDVGIPQDFYAAVMVAVPANQLITTLPQSHRYEWIQ